MFMRVLPYVYLLVVTTVLLACSPIHYASSASDQAENKNAVEHIRLPERAELIVARKERMNMEQFRAGAMLLRDSWCKEQNVQMLISQQSDLTSNEKAGIVYLTFDDGPSPITEQVLDILQEREIEATFFVLGQQVKRYPELAKRIVVEGHSIGNHSYNHVYEELYTNLSVFLEQIAATTEEIWRTTGEFTTLMRAPGGTYQNFDRTYFQAMDEAGYIAFDWNVDSGDSTSRDITAEQIIQNVATSIITPHLVVLFHDSSTHEATAAALPAIIEYYEELNYAFASLTSESPPIVSKLASSIKWDRAEGEPKEIEKFISETARLKELVMHREYLLASYGPLRE